MTLIQAIFLGILQGITEFLPISSSGHLVLLERLFNLQPSLTFNVFLHGASLMAIIIFFKKDFLRLFQDIATLFKIILGTIPIIIVGFLLKDRIESAFSSLEFVGFAFLITSGILFFTVFCKKNEKSLEELGLFGAFFIGLFQALAILPGISRSGTTISSALYQGAKKYTAFKFSFLLGSVAILGALVVEAPKLSAFVLTPSVILGFVFALIFSLLALKLLKKAVLHSKFYYFSFYCFVLGLLCLILAV